MSQLSNLVPDPANKNVWVPRPAALVFPATQAEFNPGFVSALFIAGRYAYGMVSSALNSGFDQPFAYDLIGGNYISITGITSANVPASPLTFGAWTPPTMDQVGVYILVTHPGFNGSGNGFFGWINVTNPAAPTWASGNTTGVLSAGEPTNKAGGNTGNAFIVLDPVTPVLTGAIAGTYQVIWNSRLGYTVKDPNGTTVGSGTIGGQEFDIELQFTVTVGSRDMVPGDEIDIVLSLPSLTLPSPPTFVKQFNQRAFFAVAPPGLPPATYATDSLSPLTVTNPLILTYGDNRPIFALGVLGLHNIFGGITQSLLIFQDNNIFQLTGDWGSGGSPGTISLNSLDIAVGTIAPLSIAPTPRGVAFLSQDGFRIIDWDGKISDPIGLAGTGIVTPFTNALVPSRVVAASNGQTVRITTQNNAVAGQPFQEWVFDLERKGWHGPHTFTASMISRYGSTYVVAPNGLLGLWQSDIFPNITSQYTENGVQLSWIWQSALVANQGSVYQQAAQQSTIYCAGDAVTQQFTMTAQTASGAIIDSVPISPPIAAASKWGSMVWGRDIWGAANLQMSQVVVPWDMPLVFDRVSFTMKGMSAAGIAIGEMRVVLEELEYLALTG